MEKARVYLSVHSSICLSPCLSIYLSHLLSLLLESLESAVQVILAGKSSVEAGGDHLVQHQGIVCGHARVQQSHHLPVELLKKALKGV